MVNLARNQDEVPAQVPAPAGRPAAAIAVHRGNPDHQVGPLPAQSNKPLRPVSRLVF